MLHLKHVCTSLVFNVGFRNENPETDSLVMVSAAPARPEPYTLHPTPYTLHPKQDSWCQLHQLDVGPAHPRAHSVSFPREYLADLAVIRKRL